MAITTPIKNALSTILQGMAKKENTLKTLATPSINAEKYLTAEYGKNSPQFAHFFGNKSAAYIVGVKLAFRSPEDFRAWAMQHFYDSPENTRRNLEGEIQMNRHPEGLNRQLPHSSTIVNAGKFNAPDPTNIQKVQSGGIQVSTLTPAQRAWLQRPVEAGPAKLNIPETFASKFERPLMQEISSVGPQMSQATSVGRRIAQRAARMARI